MGSVMPEPTKPPCPGSSYITPDIITDADPSVFETLTYAGTGIRVMYDRRIDEFSETNAYLFDARYRDGLTIEVQVNPEFGSIVSAETQADKYARYIGKIPTLLRVDVDTVWIHLGDDDWGGGNRNLLIHTGRGEEYENGDYVPGGPGNYVEEVLLHEAAHTSLDATHEEAPGWVTAQETDPVFISTYAEEHPDREDVAESFGPYLMVRYRPERTTDAMVNTINAAIPNRIGCGSFRTTCMFNIRNELA